MTPAIVTDANDRIIMLSGSAGGAELVDYVAQTMIAVINGVSALAAIDAGHFRSPAHPTPNQPASSNLKPTAVSPIWRARSPNSDIA
jgi:gamma-glutamyltranspeptidase